MHADMATAIVATHGVRPADDIVAAALVDAGVNAAAAALLLPWSAGTRLALGDAGAIGAFPSPGQHASTMMQEPLGHGLRPGQQLPAGAQVPLGHRCSPEQQAPAETQLPSEHRRSLGQQTSLATQEPSAHVHSSGQHGPGPRTSIRARYCPAQVQFPLLHVARHFLAAVGAKILTAVGDRRTPRHTSHPGAAVVWDADEAFGH